MKRLILIGMALLSSTMVNAQGSFGKEAQTEYERFKRKAMKEYNDFRRRANEDYARFMEETWTMFDLKSAEEIPWSPKPVEVLEATQAPSTHAQLTYEGDIVDERIPDATLDPTSSPKQEGSPGIYEQPEPIEPIIAHFDLDASTEHLLLYGSDIPIRVNKVEKRPKVELKKLSERAVARAWRRLSCPYFDNIVAECVRQRKEYNLCDWAYVKLTQNAAEKQFGEGSNEAVLLQMYLLTQSGYQMRIGRVDDRLTLLVGSQEKIFRYKYFTSEGINYYIIDRSSEGKSMYVFDRAFPGEKALSLAMRQPILQLDRTEKRQLASTRYPDMKVTVETNQNLIDFYNEYPLCSKWNYYSKASLSTLLRNSLLPAMRKAIEGKSELEAANMILNFVQTAFTYKTDEEQFGYERPLYPDETFFYPYSDCEDRSILFSCLVRELLGLDVVLLDYPGHIATAVCLSTDIDGDYLTVEGRNYYISDPTCRNAPVGYCHSKYKSKKPKVVMF